jgi:hypothetical protein
MHPLQMRMVEVEKRANTKKQKGPGVRGLDWNWLSSLLVDHYQASRISLSCGSVHNMCSVFHQGGLEPEIVTT